MSIGALQADLLPLPRLSLTERDRRYAAIRAAMSEEALDCLVFPSNNGHWDDFQADLRYVTHVGGNQTEAYAVFPVEGDVTCFIRDEGRVDWWRRAQHWTTDIRGARRARWSEAVIERLRELGLDTGRRRIGVVGLDGVLRAPEGTIPFRTFSAIRDAFPHATFVSATQLLQHVRSVKSEEEIRCLERADEIAEVGVEALVATARPGLPEYRAYAAMIGAMLDAGSEYPTLLIWRADPRPGRLSFIPTARPLQPGDLISTEVEAKYCGYIAQVDHPVSVATAPREWSELYLVWQDVFAQLSAFMQPGVTFGQIAQYCASAGEKRGVKATLVLHGRGMGEDGPLILGHPSEAVAAQSLGDGNVFILKPTVASRDGSMEVRAGDTVVIRSSGAQRLGQRPFGPTVCAG